MSLFIANVGQRDVWLTYRDREWKPLKERGSYVREVLRCETPGLRSAARAILEDLEVPGGQEHPDRAWHDPRNFRFPILVPALRHALDWLEETGQPRMLDRLVLVGTDQPEPQAGEADFEPLRGHRENDSLYAAQLIARMLPRVEPSLAGCIREVQVLTATGVNPSKSAQCYEFLNARIGALPGSEAARVFAAVRGGTPQMNAALQALALDLFGTRAVILEVDEPGREEQSAGVPGTAYAVDTLLFRKNALLRVVRPLLRQHEYSAMLGILERELTDAERALCEGALVLLRHADARFNGDFSGAERLFERLPPDTSLRAWSATLADPWARQRLQEIAAAAELLLERRDLVGFCARVATLCETCRRQLIHRLLGLEVGGEFLPEGAVTDEGLRRRLGEPTRRHATDGGMWRISTGLLAALIDWGIRRHREQRPGLAAAVEGARRSLGGFAKLEALRHQALHQNRGISDADLREVLPEGQESFRDGVRTLLEQMGRVEEASLGAATPLVGTIYPALEAEALRRVEALVPIQEEPR